MLVFKLILKFLTLTLSIKYINTSISGSQNSNYLTKCEPIRVELCRGLGYNATSLTNDLQVEAELTLQTYAPLIQFGCSAKLHFFLCSVYVPMCTETVMNYPIGPCRNLCESVRSRCYPVLQGFGFPWPISLNCSKFPIENNYEHMCMEGPEENENSIPQTLTNLLSPVRQCPKNHVYMNMTGKCAPLCDSSIMWDESEKSLAEIWLQTWSAASFFSSMLALFTFLRDPSRLYYPERPLCVFILCYLLTSIGWGIRALAGRNIVACTNSVMVYRGDGFENKHLLLQDGLDNPNCGIVFIFIYYFGMAASMWWIIICFCWMLTYGKNWSHQQINKYNVIIHILGWSVPIVQTIVVIMKRMVDADELTGICFVGNQDNNALKWFVIVPNIIYLTTGSLLLIYGYILSFRHNNRNFNKKIAYIHSSAGTALNLKMPTTHMPLSQRKKSQSTNIVHTISDFKLGVFNAIYAIPLICLICCEIYEYNMKKSILHNQSNTIPSAGSLLNSISTFLSSSSPVIPPVLNRDSEIPEIKLSIWLELFKIFMSLITGVTFIGWVWSLKLFNCRKLFIKDLNKIPSMYNNAPTNVQMPNVYTGQLVTPNPINTSSNRNYPDYPYKKVYRNKFRNIYLGNETII